MDYNWSDKNGHRDRTAFLWITLDGKVYDFKGKNIPGVCVIKKEQWVKQGKWSHTSYVLELKDQAVTLAWKNGWETGSIFEGLGVEKTWESLSAKLGVSIEEAKRFIAQERPKAAEEIEELRLALITLNDS